MHSTLLCRPRCTAPRCTSQPHSDGSASPNRFRGRIYKAGASGLHLAELRKDLPGAPAVTNYYPLAASEVSGDGRTLAFTGIRERLAPRRCVGVQTSSTTITGVPLPNIPASFSSPTLFLISSGKDARRQMSAHGLPECARFGRMPMGNAAPRIVKRVVFAHRLQSAGSMNLALSGALRNRWHTRSASTRRSQH
jgi:hypothetical protein